MAKKKKEETLQLTTKENVLLEKNIDIERIKEELEHYVDEKINKIFIEELDKSNRRLVREKSRKIIWKNIVILILLALSGFLLYLLFSNNYFDKYFNKNKEDVVEKDKQDDNKKESDKKIEPTATPEPTPTPTATPKVPTLDELKKEYGSLIDNYYVTESSSYLVDFYSGNLTDNIKRYITLNSIDFDSIKKEEDYQIISDDTFKTIYEKLFDEEYEAATFDYDDNKIRYVGKMESYMTSEFLEKHDTNIKREITDIIVDGEIVIITTVEGLIKDNKLYEIINNSEVIDYKEDSLVNYQDKLNKVVYTFKDNKLIKLGK